MTVFNEYARYYDLLYRSKDYAAEADYVHALIQGHCSGAASVLNLGCGSGRHDRELAGYGYRVTGVDLSEEMLVSARTAATENEKLTYIEGDITSIRLSEHFDVVTALFHVMSYQTTNDGLLAVFATAHAHLEPGGIFIFDCWYGPGVLTDRPVVRIKELADAGMQIIRLAEPVMHPNENVVDVNYRMFIRDTVDDSVHEVRESHRMRYLFMPELLLMLSLSGFEFVKSEEWLTARPLGYTSWNAVFVCRKPKRE